MMNFNFDVILLNIPLYLNGAWITFQLLVTSLFFGLTIAIPLAVMRCSSNKALNSAAWIYTYVIRGTPMLVQLFLVYYGMAQFDFVRNTVLWNFFSSAAFCACFAFVLNTSAYTTEILVGCLKSVPKGEIDAAKASGMSFFQLYKRILFPSAFRRALPQYSNEVIMMLQTTSLASVVTIMDITGVARNLYSEYYLPFEAFLTAAFFYLIFTFFIIRVFKFLERKWLIHLK